MKKICPKCGTKQEFEDVNFCINCGAFLSNDKDSLIQKCVYCNHPIPPTMNSCPYCGRYVNLESHKLAIVLGYIFSFISPLIAIIDGIYLLTRKNRSVHIHGIMIILISIFVVFIVIRMVV